MRKISVGIKGVFAKVDDVDHEYLKKLSWSEGGAHSGKKQYAIHEGKRNIRMHRLVYEKRTGKKIPEGMEIDHKNGDRMDNRLMNLRLATHQQNSFNVSKKTKNPISIYKGVWYRKDHGRVKRWCADIKISGKKIHIGTFLTEKEAAEAYNIEAERYQGEFACLNRISK